MESSVECRDRVGSVWSMMGTWVSLNDPIQSPFLGLEANCELEKVEDSFGLRNGYHLAMKQPDS